MTDLFFQRAEKAVRGVLEGVRGELLQHYGSIEFTAKQDKSVVTRLDKLVEEKLREALRPLDKGIGILGEEFGPEGNQDTMWLLDPIDGTQQFIRGIPSCKNLVCLVKDGQPEWALMYMFVTDRWWVARRGQGARCNGQLATMRYRSLDQAWIEAYMDYSVPANAKVLERVRPYVKGITDLRNFELLIEGKADGAISVHDGGGPWDYAPRALLVEEVGGKIANIGSDTFDFHNDTFLVAHQRNFDELMKLLTTPAIPGVTN